MPKIPYNEETLKELCASSHSYAEVLRKSGRQIAGGNQEILKKQIAKYNIDVSHFTGQLWNKGKTKETDNRIKGKETHSLDEIFCKNSHITQKVMRDYVKRYKLVPYKCQNCGCTGEWQNGTISLELDHIDGDNTNNELSNLRYLCPNCHALTSTYRGKNKKAGGMAK